MIGYVPEPPIARDYVAVDVLGGARTGAMLYLAVLIIDVPEESIWMWWTHEGLMIHEVEV